MSEQEYAEQPEGQGGEAVAAEAGPVDPATTKHWYIIHS